MDDDGWLASTFDETRKRPVRPSVRQEWHPVGPELLREDGEAFQVGVRPGHRGTQLPSHLRKLS